MKNFLLGFLTAALLAVAVSTRPTETSLRAYLAKRGDAAADTSSSGTSATSRITYVDRVLWVDARRDGRAVYSGAFGVWFPRATPKVADRKSPFVTAGEKVGQVVRVGDALR